MIPPSIKDVVRYLQKYQTKILRDYSELDLADAVLTAVRENLLLYSTNQKGELNGILLGRYAAPGHVHCIVLHISGGRDIFDKIRFAILNNSLFDIDNFAKITATRRGKLVDYTKTLKKLCSKNLKVEFLTSL